MTGLRGVPDEASLDELLRRADSVWQDFVAGRHRFAHLIPADPRQARAALTQFGGRGQRFLELGAGTGLITILADLLGFEAYGIEIEADLVTEAWRLAESAGSRATFIEGSFVPPEYREDVSLMSSDFLTITEGADAYEEMGLEMADFDVVYAYPWPGEEDWTRELVGRFGRAGAQLLTYSVREGFQTEAL